MTDEVTNISNICQLISFLKYCDYNKEKAETGFTDCSPNANAIVSCISDKFQEPKIEILHLKAFLSDEPSFIVGKKSGAATKLKTNFALKMFSIHCIYHRLALAYADTGYKYKFIRNAEEISIELWRFFKTLPRDCIYT